MIALAGMFLGIGFVSIAFVLTVGQTLGIFEKAVAFVSPFVAIASMPTAWGAIKFKANYRLPVTILAGLALPLFPIGTVIAFGLLRLMYFGSQPQLLTLEHEQLVQATPELTPRTSSTTKVIAILIVLLLVIMFVAPFITQKMVRH